MQPRAPGRRFRPDIEGLRAVAVLAVVLFHAAVPGVGGGFVGVDVFFVLSGFLITRMLWREVEASGRLGLARFYAGRARRLLPAAVTVLVATTAVATAVLPPLQVRAVLGDAVASALYVGNYRLAVQGTDYLAANGPPSPFQHYWSLGAEEQFYLFWPVLLVLAAWPARRAGGRATPVVAPAVALALVAAGSFAVSLAWTRSSPPWAYFSLPSRAWELAVGGLVAVGAPCWRRLPAVVAGLVGWAGLAVVVGSCLLLGTSTPFPGTAALAPVLGTAVVVLAGSAAPRWGVGAVLALAPLRWAGRLSFPWYLWHWPVLVLAPLIVGHALPLPGRLAAAGVSALLAAATLLLIENPVRFAAPLRRSSGRSLLLGGALTAAGVCVALVALAVAPATVGHGTAVAAPRLAAPAAPTSGPDPAAERLRALTAQVQAAVAASAGMRDVPATLSPPLDRVSSDTALPFQNGCDRGFTQATQPPCVFGDPAGTATVALIGDSHAAAWFPAVEPLAEQRHWRLDVLAKATCPFLLDLPTRSPYLGRQFTECAQWRTTVLARLQAEHPALVLLAMSRRYGADFDFTAYDASWLAALTRSVATLRASGATVLVLGPLPDPHTWAPSCLSDHLDSAAACFPARAAAVNARGVAAETAAAHAGGGRYADLTDLFCTADRCPLIVGNVLVYRDDNHVSVEYASLLGPVIAAEIAQVLPGG
ncbi:MAG: acyltransferase [Blastococcus sp.]|nr:acyltransferase [Blastococcus sp.]